MKNFLAVLAIALSLLVIYTVHQDRVRKAAEAAEAAAPPGRSFNLKPRKVMSLTEVLDPFVARLIAPLNFNQPEDLVPPLQIVKERTTEKRKELAAAELNLCDQALRCLDLMIPVAEERTETLDAIMRMAARPSAALETENSSTNSNEFFMRNTTRRWTTSLDRQRPAIVEAMTRLRSAEAAWKQAAGESVTPTNFHPGYLPPVYVEVQAADRGNPLEKTAYGRHRPWRRSYYDEYNSGSTMR
jgi:hypothetical protein